MAHGEPERVLQANHRVKAPSWLEGISGILGLGWFVFLFAAVFHFGPLVAMFERYRVLFGCLEALGGLVIVCIKLQFPLLQLRPFSWPTFADGIVSAAGFTAVTYEFEALLFPTLPNPGNAAIALGALIIALASYRIPSRSLTWINRRIGNGHAP